MLLHACGGFSKTANLSGVFTGICRYLYIFSVAHAYICIYKYIHIYRGVQVIAILFHI